LWNHGRIQRNDNKLLIFLEARSRERWSRGSHCWDTYLPSSP
jgi:hypothetical protein